jgi:hypothetical protein
LQANNAAAAAAGGSAGKSRVVECVVQILRMVERASTVDAAVH